MKKALVLDERELKEVHHALYYYRYLKHGTVGHNLLMLVGKMADAIGFYFDVDDEDDDNQHADVLMLDGEPALKDVAIGGPDNDE